MMTLGAMALRYASIVAVCWRVIRADGFQYAHDAPAIVQAIAWATMWDAAPVFGTPEAEAAVASEFAVRESGLQLRPRHWVDPRTGLMVDSRAQGAWQIRGPAGLGTPAEQIAEWLKQLHAGERDCPPSPAADLSGSCVGARALADRRVRRALTALEEGHDSISQTDALTVRRP